MPRQRFCHRRATNILGTDKQHTQLWSSKYHWR
jgi:hypothetical protein